MDTVYHGLTADELARQLDVETTVESVDAYREENLRMSEEARLSFPAARLDVAYGGDPEQKLDIFAPPAPDNQPVMIYIHGGGWRSGSKNTASFVAKAMCGRGVIWVPIDYGLAPDYRIDAIVGHVRSAVAWVYDEIALYGGDPEEIYVSGNSAGGHLTGAILMPGWHGAYGVPANVVKGACAMSGVFDLDSLLLAAYGYNNELQLTAESARANSPQYHLPMEAGPLIVAVGAPEPDEFRRQSAAYAAAWAGMGLDGKHMEIPDANHFMMVRELGNPEGDLFNDVMEMIGV
ncbi:MAG: alpha/beta hydrolase [Rhodospirillales bacterium]|nr:alpha/beta hydrolase [Rhodospirillales bacterium]